MHARRIPTLTNPRSQPLIASFMLFILLSILLLAGGSTVGARPYVAFGDSVTTGSSVASCQEDRQQSPWGCKEFPTLAVPYPNRVAQALGYSYSDNPKTYTRLSNTLGLTRVGIWGFTVKEAAADDIAAHVAVGNWEPQLYAVRSADQLVTGNLGINDLHFSDVIAWSKRYLAGGDAVEQAVDRIMDERAGDFQRMLSALDVAQNNGAKIVLTLYYNPYSSDLPGCQTLKSLSGRIVDHFDDQMFATAQIHGYSVVDLRRSFEGHGAGSRQPYVFGKQCSLDAALKSYLPTLLRAGPKAAQHDLGVMFDPHPNNNGTAAISMAIVQEVNNAD